MAGFQNSVNNALPIGVAGDFATANPRASVPSGESAFVAGTGGVTVGRFAWVQANGTILNAAVGTEVPTGFVHREQQALITTYLAEASNVVPAGFPVTLMRSGDYLVTVTVASAERGEKAFAKLTDGTIQPGAAGAVIAGYVETDFFISVGGAVGELATMGV